MHDDELDDELTVGIAQALRTLPLLDQPYLHMQAMNLDIIDCFLVESETNLLREYIQTEHTPFPAATFVSALSQLWLFGLYELLRTWRQRVQNVLEWHKEFRREKGSFAMAPGYGRIDMTDGSIYWEGVLRGDEIDVLSRRDIANQCRRLIRHDPLVVLPESIQEKIKKFPNIRYGGKRVTVTLNDGHQYSGVHVAWNKEVMCVDGYDTIPFDAERVVDAQHDPRNEDNTAP
jgi:hypothetical protein